MMVCFERSWRNEICALSIPAFSGSVGSRSIIINAPNNESRNFDMNDSAYRPHDWPRWHVDFKDNWLHSDIKDVAYFTALPQNLWVNNLNRLGLLCFVGGQRIHSLRCTTRM